MSEYVQVWLYVVLGLLTFFATAVWKGVRVGQDALAAREKPALDDLLFFLAMSAVANLIWPAVWLVALAWVVVEMVKRHVLKPEPEKVDESVKKGSYR